MKVAVLGNTGPGAGAGAGGGALHDRLAAAPCK